MPRIFECLINCHHTNCHNFLGILRIGQEIEVRPGIVTKTSEGRVQCRPIFSRILSLFAEQNELQYAVPGGLHVFLYIKTIASWKSDKVAAFVS